MDIQSIKEYLKNKKITYEQLSELSGIPLNTIKNIFSRRTPNPRVDTMQAIECALGITNERADAPAYTEDEKKLLALISELTEEETQELSNYIDFIISKRK
jgi:transcriptional regulator with XRE-family HTH domain